MHINLVPFFVLWLLLFLSVVAMVFWRKSVASHEDDSLHVLQGSVAQQVSLAQRLEVIDKWGKLLTVITAVTGVILAAAWVYQTYVSASMGS